MGLPQRKDPPVWSEENEAVLDALRELPVFDGIETETLKQVGDLVKLVSFQKDEVLLQEGQVNDRLYFLMEGKVKVYSQGELLTHLNRKGDLLGEMSLITEQPCNATIVADSEKVELCMIRTKDLGSLPKKAAQQFENALAHLYALILAKKLADTNEKAKGFERTNRELEKTKDALQAASKRRLQELMENRDLTIGKLIKVHDSKLDPIKKDLLILETEIPEENSVVLKQAIQGIDEVINIIKPLKAQYASEVALKSKHILVAETESEQREIIKMALGGTGVRLEFSKSSDDLRDKVRNSIFDIVSVNRETAELIPEIQRWQPTAKLVYVSGEAIAETIQTLRKHPAISNIVVRHDQDRTFTVKNILTTFSKLLNQDFIGLEKYLNWGAEVIEYPVSASSEREELIGRMEDYFKKFGIRKALLQRCTLAAEELLMNAIYDAPTDSDGKPLYNHLSRKVEVNLKPVEQSVFRYACDGMILAVSVKDPFGALTRETIVDYLEGCIEGKDLNSKRGKGGAGMGLYSLINRSSLVIFNVKPWVTTEVICLFNINLQVSKIANHPSFHFFLDE